MQEPPKALRIYLVFPLLLVAAASLASDEAARNPKLDDLSFLAGCWEGNLEDGSTIRETFTSARGGMMLGNSQVTAAGKTVFFEYMRIVEDESGIAYYPSPNNQEADPFPLVRAKRGEAIFENPKNDFPQRIVYSSPARGKLTARIELIDGNRAQELPMEAVPCSREAYQAAIQ